MQTCVAILIFAVMSCAQRVDAQSPSPPNSVNTWDIVVRINQERGKVGLPLLSIDNRLIAVADAKNKDMVDHEYIAHVSTSGVDLKMLLTKLGYAHTYMEVGENLALGDFTSSDDVMDSFMASPDHRSNILDKNYSVVGISVQKRNYHGIQTWYVVQEFGRLRTVAP